MQDTIRLLMEEILLNLICQEYEIDQERLFSKSRNDDIIKPIAMMTYILHVNKGWEVASIHLFYTRKGYTKTRATLYHLIKKASHEIQFYSMWKEAYDSIVKGIELAKSAGVIVEEDAYLHSVRGRVTAKLFRVTKHTNLDKVEFLIDRILQTEFITEGQYNEKN